MKEPKWLLPGVVLAIHERLLAEHGGLPGLRDRALLDAALHRPRQIFSYADQPSWFDLAAAYGEGLIRNHPFVDGNKRIALTATAVFLEINGISLQAPEAEAALVFERLAAGDFGCEELARWLERHAVIPR